MEIQHYIEKMREIQSILLEYIDNEDIQDENHSNFISIINDFLKDEDEYKLLSFLNLLNEISNNHHRCRNFFTKIFQILLLYKDQITKYFTNEEIYRIFQTNMRIILFLIEEKILTITYSIANQMKQKKYDNYFCIEMRPFFNDLQMTQLPENFEEKRRIGENDSYICQLIRDDNIIDFIVYLNKTNLNPKSTINHSIFETNNFLIIRQPTLIEYALFYGSIRIFDYLRSNNDDIKMTESLLNYSIQSGNSEIFCKVFENLEKPPNYFNCLKLAINSFNNDIANYIINNDFISNNENIKNIGLNYYNFEFIEIETFNQFTFNLLCQFKYEYMVKFLLKNGEININSKNAEITKSSFDGGYFDDKGNDSYREEKPALYIAVENRNIFLTKLLLENENIDVNLKYLYLHEKHFTYLSSSCKFERITDKIERTPLFLAVENQDVEIVKLLLKHPKIDTNIKLIIENKKDDYNGISHYENKQGEKPYEIELTEKVPLHIAIEKENFEIFKLLIENEKIDFNIKYLKRKVIYQTETKIEKTALHLIAELNKIEYLNLLLNKQNVDFNIKRIDFKEDYNNYVDHKNISDEIDEIKQSPLIIAYEMNNKEIVKLLLQNQNVDVNSTSEKYYLTYHHDEYCSYKNETNVEKIYQKTLLHLACEKKDVEMVMLLMLNPFIDVNIISIDSNKLSFNSQYGKRIRRCIYKKETTIKKTALIIAIENNKIDIVNLLLSCHNIDVNFKPTSVPKENAEYSKTALYTAVEKRNIDIVKALLMNPKIDVNALMTQNRRRKRKRRQRTALHLAVLNKDVEIIKLLVSVPNINKDLKDEHERTPFDIATNEEIKSLLH